MKFGRFAGAKNTTKVIQNSDPLVGYGEINGPLAELNSGPTDRKIPPVIHSTFFFLARLRAKRLDLVARAELVA